MNNLTTAKSPLRLSEVSYFIEEEIGGHLFDSAVLPIKGFFNEHRFLSNFWKCWIEYEGKWYGSTEHAYQAAKFLEDKDRDMVRFARSPNDAKKLGQRPGLRADWDHVKDDVMRDVLILKFGQPELAEQLLATGMAYLEETNHWGDRYWGVDGTGKNKLGRLLMEIRADLRKIMEGT